MNPIVFVIVILFVLTYTIGLNLKTDDLKMVVKRPTPMLIGLTGQLVILPLIAFLVGYFFNLDAVFFIGLVLIACCPGGSSSNIFTLIAKGDIALSVSMTAISSFATLITLPFIMALCIKFTNVQNLSNIEFPLSNILIQNLVLMFVPIILGAITKYFFKEGAKKLSRVLEKLAFPSLAFIATMFFIKNVNTIVSHLDLLFVCVLTLVILAIIISSVLSQLFKQDRKIKRTIVIEVAMQNAALAIALSVSPFAFNNEIMSIPAIIYALLMNIALLIYVGAIKVKDRKLAIQN